MVVGLTLNLCAYDFVFQEIRVAEDPEYETLTLNVGKILRYPSLHGMYFIPSSNLYQIYKL